MVNNEQFTQDLIKSIFSDFVLKGQTFITAGERSVTCGKKKIEVYTASNATLACGYENQALRAKQRKNRIAALPVDAKKR